MHAKQVKRLLIRNAMVIYGNATPAFGPVDILSEDGIIARVGTSAASGPEHWPDADMIIDATGKYVMPGIINTHMHWHEERVGPIPIQYERNLYLAAGVTTAREVGGNIAKTLQWRAESAAHTIVAPRIVAYPMLTDLVAPNTHYGKTPQEIRALVRSAKQRGADGLKLIGPMDRDQAAAAIAEAKLQGLRTTVHIAVAETTARDFVDLGINCIEHFYGIGDASLDGIQEAGFQPLEVLKHATVEGAKVLGLDDRLGRVREGFIADLLVINGNPLENLRLMNAYGTDIMTYNGQPIDNYSGIVRPGDPNVKMVHGGGIEWTIKAGIPYHVPTLMNEVKEMVAKARKERDAR